MKDNCKIHTISIDLNDSPDKISEDFLIEIRSGYCIKCGVKIRVKMNVAF